MPDIKFSQLEVVTAAAANDSVPIIDASNPLMSENGSNAIISIGDLADSLFDGLSDGALSSAKIQTNPTFTGDVTLPATTTIGSVTGTEISFLSGLRDNIQSQLDGFTFGGLTSTEIGYLSGITSSVQTQLNSKAPRESPTFTGTVSGITATMVGLSDVDNTSDASKPVSTATQTALNLKANLASPTFTGTVAGITATMVGLGAVTNESKGTMFSSPTFTGTPLSTTASVGTNTTQIATTAFVQSEIINSYNNILEISTSTLTLSSTHYNKYVRLSNAGAITIILPVLTSAPVGTTITFRRNTGAGSLTLTAANGVTVNNNDAATVLAGEVCAIKNISSNTWDFI
jgi:hypothetical protein